ncbi:hypothetical protein H6F56_09485 [Microcoleus sp. FACHB-672]|nr:hypothetical protein [Microcoleus sp. FACHB-672]
MLFDSELPSKVEQIWDRLWSPSLSKLIDSIKRFHDLLFLKRLNNAENRQKKPAKRPNKPFDL